jgi:hypothetical protein
MAHARQTGMLVMKPNKNELKPATAAVEVTSDRCSSVHCQREACGRSRRLTLNANCVLIIRLAKRINPCGIVADTSAARVG